MTPVNSNWRRRWRAIRTDQCSLSPDLWLANCCDDHDRAYHTHRDAAGRQITRAQADAIFFRCCRAAGWNKPIIGPIAAVAYWLAVRIFGAGYWKRRQVKTGKT